VLFAVTKVDERRSRDRVARGVISDLVLITRWDDPRTAPFSNAP
jgi:hypothetical protein